MGSKFFINYLRQKWWQINDLYVAVALYWVWGYAAIGYPVQLWTNPNPSLTLTLCAIVNVAPAAANTI